MGEKIVRRSEGVASNDVTLVGADASAFDADRLSEGQAAEILDVVYQSALNGVPKVSRSVEEMAQDYLAREGSPRKAAIALARWQVMKCGTSGFVTGLGGLLTLPVAIPANISSVLYVQMRMIGAIARMGGFDVKSDQVQTMVYMCLTGTTVADVVKQTGVTIGTKTATAAIKKIPGAALTKINQKIGYRLLTKFGEKGVINLGKMVPLVGGVVGGGMDVVATQAIAKSAIAMFIDGQSEDDASSCENVLPTELIAQIEAPKNVEVGACGSCLVLPGGMRELRLAPDDPDDMTCFGGRGDGYQCVVNVRPVSSDAALPMDEGLLLDGARLSLSDRQGIIAASCCKTAAGMDVAFTIVKTVKKPGGISYALTMDVRHPTGAIGIQGTFDERGTTGMRDSLVMAKLRNEGKIGPSHEGWSCDPYDCDYTSGIPMNRSEAPEYDEYFPGHPLSVCRMFVDGVLALN